MPIHKFFGATIAAAAVLVSSSVLAQSTEVNVYSYREPGLIQPLLDQFTAETGIKTNVLFAGDGLLERVAAEGELSPVDVVLTVDIGNLVGAKEQGLTQPITTPALAERLAPEFRDADAGRDAEGSAAGSGVSRQHCQRSGPRGHYRTDLVDRHRLQPAIGHCQLRKVRSSAG